MRGRGILHAIVFDITERKRAEEALRASEARLRGITDSVRDAIVMMDPQGVIGYWNPAAESILGYTYDEAVGLSLYNLLTPQRYRESNRRQAEQHHDRSRRCAGKCGDGTKCQG